MWQSDEVSDNIATASTSMFGEKSPPTEKTNKNRLNDQQQNSTNEWQVVPVRKMLLLTNEAA